MKVYVKRVKKQMTEDVFISNNEHTSEDNNISEDCVEKQPICISLEDNQKTVCIEEKYAISCDTLEDEILMNETPVAFIDTLFLRHGHLSANSAYVKCCSEKKQETIIYYKDILNVKQDIAIKKAINIEINNGMYSYIFRDKNTALQWLSFLQEQKEKWHNMLGISEEMICQIKEDAFQNEPLVRIFKRIKNMSFFAKSVLVDALIWLLYVLFEKNIFPDNGELWSGIFGTLGFIGLLFVLICIWAMIGGPSDRQMEYLEIQKKNRMWNDAQRYYDDLHRKRK